MPKKISLLTYPLVSLNILFLILSFLPTGNYQQTKLISPIINSAAASTDLKTEPINIFPNIYPLDQTPYNVLLLGLDGRKGEQKPRCDAIHMFSFDPKAATLTITSVPRGTRVSLPQASTASAYLANSCHTQGIDYTVDQIEKITGIIPDAIVKVGFSQTLGILRTFGFPTTSSLQFLRNRRYAIGDHQRSHNQALFIKDMILSHLKDVSKLPKEVKYLIFRSVDSNLDFELADSLTNHIISLGISDNPDKIILDIKPAANPYIKEIHFPGTKYASESSLFNDYEFQKYQTDLQNYLLNLVRSAEKDIENNYLDNAYKRINIPFNQKLWLQIEDEKIRDQIHYDLLTDYVLSSPDKKLSTSQVLDFINEMETSGKENWSVKGHNLLEYL